MHIGILSDPHNFHTQKWAQALEDAGAKVTVFGFEPPGLGTPTYVQLPPRYARAGKASYLSYLTGGKDLAEALKSHQVDVLNPMNVTPFGVWGHRSGFHPVIQSALGADILEYPPSIKEAPHLKERAWSHIEGNPGPLANLKYRVGRKFFRSQVAAALAGADLATGDNQHLLDKMSEWFGVDQAKLKTLIYGIEPELFQSGVEILDSLREKLAITPEQRVILSPRGAKSIYQADIILGAFEKVLKDKSVQHKFVMLSAGYEVSQKVAEQATRMEKEYPQFKFVAGKMPREEVYALWNLVDLFISAPVYDGYSASLAEGRYVGAIPVVNDIPANREVIRHGENGWISSPFTAGQLARDMNNIMLDIEGWKLRISQINREWIEKHSLVRKNAAMFLEWAEELRSG